MRWHEGAEPSIAGILARVAKRLRLGEEAAHALTSLAPEFGATSQQLAFLFAVHRDFGGDLAGMLQSAATQLEGRARATSEAQAASSGAVLSGRMIAALPLLCLPLLPMSHAPLLDPLGLAMLGVGMALGFAGLTWIGRLVPAPPDGDDPVATLCDQLASVLGAGIGLRQALDLTAQRASGELAEPLGKARRQVLLSSSWPGALAASHRADLRRMGEVLARSHELGVPLGQTLRSLAADLRAQRRVAFEERTRKAPVMMVVPLVLCVLPSFLLLVLGPFVRGLSGS